ncbi:hypothetical protein WJX75_003349 [Coccomyxa subellipsoidea]|uniref:Glycoside hydrolase family 31 N-terminal domain-containing protein n=1 Tax=Coccomyxa subellipsoidea TaxID=248742 RepID=A0ABR2YDN3_9CHLO
MGSRRLEFRANNQVKLTVKDCAGDTHPLLIVFYTPSVFRLRFDPFSDHPYAYNKGSGDSYAVIDDRKIGTDQPYPYAIVKENPTEIPIKIEGQGSDDKALTITVQGTHAVKLVISKDPYGMAVLDAKTGEVISSDADPAIQFKEIGRDKGSFRIDANNTVNYDRVIGSTIGLRKKEAGRKYYGCGMKSGFSLDKGGQAMTFFNYDNYSYPPNSPSVPLYISVPLLLEVNPTKHALGIFLDNPGQTYFDLGNEDIFRADQTFMGALFGELNQWYIYGGPGPASLSRVVQDYTALTGRIPRPPTFALGYQQGCYGYKNDKLLYTTADTFRARGIPCDGLHIDVDFADRYKSFTHDPVAFPDVTEFFENLDGKGFKCATNIVAKITINTPIPPDYPALVDGQKRDVFVTDPIAAHAYNDQPYYVGQQVYGTDPDNNLLISFGYYPDLTKPENREWWGEQYQSLDKFGFQMVWQDMMCPAVVGSIMKTLPLYIRQYDFGKGSAHGQIHNVYGQTMIMGTYEGLQKIYAKKAVDKLSSPAQRPFIIARGGYAGAQRYAAHWTGDNVSSWDHYRMNFPMVINMALSGYAIAGANVGGFAPNYDPNIPAPPNVTKGTCPPDLLSRWITGASFLPWFQVHYNGYLKPFQEPWCYGADVERVCKRFIVLRYQLIQLWSDLVAEAAKSGVPPARALFLAFPADAKSHDYADDQFMLGDALLVAPVVTQNAVSRKVYLPKGPGSWYKINDSVLSGTAPLGQPIKAGTLLDDVAAPLFPDDSLDAVPLYAPASALLPLKLPQQYVGDRLVNPLTLAVFPAATGAATPPKYVLTEDDGITVGYKAGQVRTTEFTLQPSNGNAAGVSLSIAVSSDYAGSMELFWYVKFLGRKTPNQVQLGAAALPPVNGPALGSTPKSAYAFDAVSQSVLVKIFIKDVSGAKNGSSILSVS